MASIKRKKKFFREYKDLCRKHGVCIDVRSAFYGKWPYLESYNKSNDMKISKDLRIFFDDQEYLGRDGGISG